MINAFFLHHSLPHSAWNALCMLGIYFQNLVKETWQSCLTVEQNYLADPRAKIIDWLIQLRCQWEFGEERDVVSWNPLWSPVLIFLQYYHVGFNNCKKSWPYFFTCFSNVLFLSTSWGIRFVNTEVVRILPADSPSSISCKSCGIEWPLLDSFHLSSTWEIWNGVNMRIHKFLSKYSNSFSWMCKCCVD